MQITVPTTSTAITDVLTAGQKESIMDEKKYHDNSSLRLEVHGGTMWWTALEDTAVVDECASISDGDIEFIELQDAINVEEIQIIAGSGVTCNIEVV